jgi:HEAT repeat protein
MPNFGIKINKLIRLSFVVLLFAATGLSSLIALHAQRARETSVSLLSIQARPTRDGAIVTLSADTPLTRTQMWKDDEGFHIVLPDGEQSRVARIPQGVQVRRVGGSLEILVQVKPDADVKVQPLFNRLTLLVSGGLDLSRRESFEQSTVQEPCKPASAGANFNDLLPCDKRELLGLMSSAPVNNLSSSQPEQSAAAATVPSPPTSTDSSISGTASMARPMDASGSVSGVNYPSLAEMEAAQRNRSPLSSTQGSTSEQALPANVPTIAYDDESDLPRTKVQVKKEESVGFFSSIFSPVGVVAFVGPGMLLVLLFRQRRIIRTQGIGVWEDETIAKPDRGSNKLSANPLDSSQGSSRHSATLTKENVLLKLEMHPLELTLDGLRPLQSASSTDQPATLFGEERIQQEVSLLLKGEPYSFDVLSSRAVDDRKVFEASLLAALNAIDLSEDERARARRALEDHGFILRRGAALLSATDAGERASAARTLAEMSSPSSIPFLLEAINDPEATVRTEAIGCIGVLKEPSAIGPLLDAARRHPDVSIKLLRDVLVACTFESTVSFDAANGNLSSAANGDADFAEKVRQLASTTNIEDLPESLDDEILVQSLSRIEDEDLMVRVAAARTLGQFRALCAIRALTTIGLLDLEPGVRAAAATSLGNINHESAFAHLLIAHSDESREVQAAAARSLSRLNVDRAEAFVRLLEMADEQTLREVMRSCIKTGMISQAVGKLSSTDRRQAYEAFSLLSLLEKLKETQVLQAAIEHCQDSNARSAARAVFGLSGPVPATS